MCGHPETHRTPGSAACPKQSPSESIPGTVTSQQGLTIKLRLFPARLGRGQKSPEEWSFPEGLFFVSLGAIGNNSHSGHVSTSAQVCCLCDKGCRK